MKHLENFLEEVLDIAIKSGNIILDIYQSGEYATEIKQDATPVTDADKLASQYIVKALMNTGIPIVSEEEKIEDYAKRKAWDRFWLIDPLDGTKEFLNKNGEFTVNIALVENRKPVLGVVFAPVSGWIYYGIVGEGAYRAKVVEDCLENVEKLPLEDSSELPIVVVSRSYRDERTDSFIAQLGNHIETITVGSSLKFCLIATADATYYPRFVKLKEWDIAAGVAIVLASGGVVEKVDGGALQFNSLNLDADMFIAKRKRM